MDTEEILSSRQLKHACVSCILGMLSLVILEMGDDFIPAIFMAFFCVITGIVIIFRLKKDYIVDSLPFFFLGLICPVYGFDGFFEDIAEFFLGLGAILGFVMAIFSILSLLISYQKESENK
ncbi:MAG: hypothetical protein SPE30_07270 [Candidatus Treponema excrementipullorum]|nr:hypothetical protein [Spirochaetia bacterium]MCI6953758.1 hypothetical protein [Spirochaetia bacterium]MCI7589193.1 hypothetical protein [Spirochaetia bacterium]MDD7011821.1 hypothetical protein [Candidatus Treponema excrementipullorum]MDY4466069.1 hypothetical protein [Candidatus Treponema excrementipullorum]